MKRTLSRLRQALKAMRQVRTLLGYARHLETHSKPTQVRLDLALQHSAKDERELERLVAAEREWSLDRLIEKERAHPAWKRGRAA